MQPKYRSDIKGQVAAFKADFADQLRGEIQNADCFVLDVTDTDQYREYSAWLTDSEMKAIAKQIH